MLEPGSFHRLLLLLSVSAMAIPSTVQALTPGERALTSAPRLLLGAEPGEGFGEVLASPGDITGDGIGDLLVGAPASREGSGRVYLFSGADILGAAALSVSEAWAFVQGGAGWSYGSEIEVLGDVNGDGWPDWGVGAPTFPGGDAPPGRVWVVSGRLTVADEPVGELTPADAFFAVSGPGGSAMMGEGLAAVGDVNGDGLSDFALLHRDPNTNAESGELHVVLGRPEENWPVAPALEDLSSWSYLIDGLGDPGLGFTLSNLVVAAGDRDADGVGDLFLGMPGFTDDAAGASTRAGAVVLLPGLAPGERADAAAVALTRVLPDTALLRAVSVIDAHFGQPLSVLDSIGGQTLWVGAEGPDSGRSVGLPISGLDLDRANATTLVAGQGVLGSPQVLRADLDGDAVTGLLVSTPRIGETAGTRGFGRVSVMAPELTETVELSSSFASFVGGDEFAAGSALVVANLDGDDYDDTFVGAPGAFLVGAVFVLVGGDLSDGDGVSPAGGDCDDSVATVFPGALEISNCADNLDNDCNGLVDEEDAPCALEGSGLVVGCSTAAGGSGGVLTLLLLVAGMGLRRSVWACLAPLAVGLSLVAVGGCLVGPLPTEVAPAIRIVSPGDEGRVPETSILPVVVEVDGVTLAAEALGEVPVEAGADEPQLPPKALWALFVDGIYRSTGGGLVQVVEGLTPGIHIVRVELRDTADLPFEPEVSAEISVEIIAGEPALVLIDPTEGAVVSPVGFDVRYEVDGFFLSTASIGSSNQLGVGHVVVRIDDATVATDGDGAVFVTGVAGGERELVVELVNNDGSSLGPVVSETVNIVVAEPVIEFLSPTDDAILAGPNITIEYEVANFTLDPTNINGSPEAGRGHTHVYVDGLYQGLDPTGSFEVQGLKGCAHTARLELAQAGHTELGISSEVNFEVRPCLQIEALTSGDSVVGPQVILPFVTPGFVLDGIAPSAGGRYVTQYLDGAYVGFTVVPGSASFTGVGPGEHVFELRLAEGPISDGLEQDGELSPGVAMTISLDVQ